MTRYTGKQWGTVAKVLLPWSAAAAVAISIGSVGFGTLGLGGAASAQSVDLDQVFWCDESVGPIGDQAPEECMAARDRILSSCTSCHTFAPIVLSQYTEEEWDAVLARHRGRVAELSDEDWNQISEFLKAHYNPDNPQPELPEALRNYTLPPA